MMTPNVNNKVKDKEIGDSTSDKKKVALDYIQ